MTMYLSNSELGPTGHEITEFIDVPPMAETPAAADYHFEPREGTTARLDAQTRLTIARWAEEYIAGLVGSHDGDPADVRSIIDELQRQRAVQLNHGRAADLTS